MGSTLQTRYCLEELLKDSNHEIPAVFALDEKTRFQEGGYTTKVRSAEFFDLEKQYDFKLHLGSMKNPANEDLIKKLNPDLILAPGSSEIIPGNLLNIPKFGSIGSHGALLPYVKGGASMNWALIFGEKKWGTSLFYLTEEIDEGTIVGVKEFPVYENDNINSLHNRADLHTVDLIKEILPFIEDGSLKPIIDTIKTIKLQKRKPQKNGINWNEIFEWNKYIINGYNNRDMHKRVYLPSRKSADGIINWDRSNEELYNWIRALTHPFHGAFTFLKNKKTCIWGSEKIDTDEKNDPGIIYEINNNGIYTSTKGGSLLIKKIQYGNEPELHGYDFCLRHNIKIGDKFSNYPKND